MGVQRRGHQRHAQIVQTAKNLFYSKGYARTSFSDIADVCGVNRGNFYYYFKTKEDLLTAVVHELSADLTSVFDRLDVEFADPKSRLKGFIHSFNSDRELRKLYGCAIGSLAMELTKEDRSLLGLPATLVEQTLDWLAKQFGRLFPTGEPRKLAIEVFGRMQGANLLGAIYSDATLLDEQFEEIGTWIDRLDTSA